MQLDELFSPALSLTRVEGRSKKRLFETVSHHISRQKPELNPDELFDLLIARERLGSTGLGEGVALPHCRLNHSDIDCFGVLVQLEKAIDFDAPDQQPVDLLAFLLVSSEAAQDHLNALSLIAKNLSDADVRTALRAADSPRTLCAAMLA